MSKFVSKLVQEYNTKIYKDKRKKYEIMVLLRRELFL